MFHHRAGCANVRARHGRFKPRMQTGSQPVPRPKRDLGRMGMAIHRWWRGGAAPRMRVSRNGEGQRCPVPATGGSDVAAWHRPPAEELAGRPRRHKGKVRRGDGDVPRRRGGAGPAVDPRPPRRDATCAPVQQRVGLARHCHVGENRAGVPGALLTDPEERAAIHSNPLFGGMPI